MTTLKFGKYAGETISDVALIDPDYALWASGNLRNATLAKEFADALAATKRMSAEQLAKARYALEGEDAHYNAILDKAVAEKAEQSKEENSEALIRRWAAEAGKPVSAIRGVINATWSDWQEVPVSKFSSKAQYDMFRRYMQELY